MWCTNRQSSGFLWYWGWRHHGKNTGMRHNLKLFIHVPAYSLDLSLPWGLYNWYRTFNSNHLYRDGNRLRTFLIKFFFFFFCSLLIVKTLMLVLDQLNFYQSWFKDRSLSHPLVCILSLFCIAWVEESGDECQTQEENRC